MLKKLYASAPYTLILACGVQIKKHRYKQS